MTLREVLTGKMANKGFAVVPEGRADLISFEGMGNGKRATVLLPKNDPEDVEAAAEGLLDDLLAQIRAL